MDQQLTQKILGAVQNGNKRALNTLLGCTQHAEPMVSSLHPSTVTASILFDAWRFHFNFNEKKGSMIGSLSFVLGLQALLMIYPCYVTPWMAISELTQHFPHLSRDEMYYCVSTVAVFLREATGSQSFACEEWIILTTKGMVDMLLDESLQCNRDRNVSLCDLICNVFLFGKNQLSDNVNRTLRNAVFQRTFSVNTIRLWMLLVQRLRSVATAEEMNMMIDRICTYIHEHGSEMSVDGLATILDVSMEFAKWKGNDSTLGSLQNFSAWYRIPLHVLITAQTRAVNYATLEIRLFDILKTSSTEFLSKFLESMDHDGDSPEWVQARILVILCQCTQHCTSIMIPTLFVERENQSVTEALTTRCVGKLLDLTFPEKRTIKDLCLSGMIEDDKSFIVEILVDFTYCGEGIFREPDGTNVGTLTSAGKILYSIVSSNDHRDNRSDEHHAYSHSKSTAVIEIAEAMLYNGKLPSDTRVVLFFAVTITVLYHALPPRRNQIIELIRKGLLWKGTDTTCKHTCIATISLIVGSIGGLAFDTTVANHFLNPCLLLLRQPLDAETFMHIIACVAATSSARKELLRSSESLLSQAHPIAWEERNPKTTRDDCIARAGLFGLLEILRSSPWQEDEIEAWSILSDCIVMDNPHLNLSDRRWIYQQIEDMLKDDDLDKSASIHFLRATIVRLAKYVLKDASGSPIRFVPENAFIVWEDPVTGLTNTKQTEDIVCLLRLSLSLMFHGSLQEIACIRSSTKAHDMLLYRVLGYNNQAKNAHTCGMSTKLRCWWEEPDLDTFSIQLITLVSYLATIVDYLAQLDKSYPSKGAPEVDDFSVLEHSISFLLQEERRSIGNGSQDTLPIWLRGDASMHFSSREVDVEPHYISPVNLSLCELLAEVLCGLTCRNFRGSGNSLTWCRSMMLAVGFMLQLRQNFEVLLLKQQSMYSPVTFETTTVSNMVLDFFSSASRIVQDLITQNTSLEESDEFFKAIILFCHAIEEVPNDLERGAWSWLLQSFWSLYQVVASENGATRFVAYLESNIHLESHAAKADTSGSICSLKSIRSSADVDDSIRNIRLTILRTLEKIVRYAPFSTSNQHVIRDGIGLPSDQTKSEESDVLLVAGILRAISHDLRVGLEGKSGGITSQMYESYLASIQSCGGLIYQLSTQTEADASCKVFSIIIEALSSLREILRSFTLEDATLFRSSLILAISELPSLLRFLLRNAVTRHVIDPTKLNHWINPEHEMTTGLFDDCLSILLRWSTLRDPNSMPWEDIAGKVHFDEVNEASVEISQYSLGDGQKAHEAISDGGSNGVVTHHQVEVALRTKELWSWGLSCTFVAWEENWLDSYQAILSSPKHGTNPIEKGCLEGMMSFFALRQMNLNSSLRKAAALFSSCTAVEESQLRPVVLDMLAMNLPSAPRLRFCHFIASISRVLINSIRHICTTLNANATIESSSLMETSLLEAVSATGAWLLFDDQKTDFSVGTFRWLSILRRKRPSGQHPNKRIDTTELLPWVTKASLLVRDLHSGLRSLERALSRNSKLEILDVAVGTFFPGGVLEMLRLTTQKLRILELTMPSEYSAPSLPDFPSLNEIKRSKKKRTRRHWSHLRLKKRPATQIARSRNRIVNAFMSLDLKSSEKDEKASDAFVDLEDFLVEG